MRSAADRESNGKARSPVATGPGEKSAFERAAASLWQSGRSMPRGLRPELRGAAAIGAVALGALAVGALSVGALAVGRMAIGRLAVGRTRLSRLDVGRLRVGTLEVGEIVRLPPGEDRH